MFLIRDPHLFSGPKKWGPQLFSGPKWGPQLFSGQNVGSGRGFTSVLRLERRSTTVLMPERGPTSVLRPERRFAAVLEPERGPQLFLDQKENNSHLFSDQKGDPQLSCGQKWEGRGGSTFVIRSERKSTPLCSQTRTGPRVYSQARNGIHSHKKEHNIRTADLDEGLKFI